MTWKQKAVWFSGTFILAGAMLLQFFPMQWVNPMLVQSNPPVQHHIHWDSPQTEAMIRRACYDCHSNETHWPWFTRLAPASWVSASTVNTARSHFNLSVTQLDTGYAELMAWMIESRTMPPDTYRSFHPEADLTAEERAQLAAGIRLTAAQNSTTVSR